MLIGASPWIHIPIDCKIYMDNMSLHLNTLSQREMQMLEDLMIALQRSLH